MDWSSYTPGQRIESGSIFRRIPPDEAHFNYEEGRPESLTFQPRPQDNDLLSANLDEAEARIALDHPRHKNFGLCSIAIGRMMAETEGRVSVEFSPSTRRSGTSHVRVHGLHDELQMQEILADIAVVVVRPTKST